MSDNKNLPITGARPFTDMREAPADDLETARTKKVPHGPLCSIAWHHYSSGMMIDSSVSENTAMEWQADGTVILRVTVTRGSRHREERIYRADRETAEEVLALTEEENLAGWGNLRYDPSQEPIMYDFSSDTSVLLSFSGTRPVTIGYKAADRNGGRDVLTHLHDLLTRCAKDDRLISSSGRHGTTPLIMGMGMPTAGEWTCPRCGYDRNSGRFCSECGEARFWVCPECGKNDNTGKYCSECGRKRD